MWGQPEDFWNPKYIITLVPPPSECFSDVSNNHFKFLAWGKDCLVGCCNPKGIFLGVRLIEEITDLSRPV